MDLPHLPNLPGALCSLCWLPANTCLMVKHGFSANERSKGTRPPNKYPRKLTQASDTHVTVFFFNKSGSKLQQSIVKRPKPELSAEESHISWALD
mmetsp:Transcript_1537/g.3284  ORF Transcript_1537/g.3284 Transcript_1537/m.3284 type:complete len:95 (-) Transcript_1537:3057-3341(-)